MLNKKRPIGKLSLILIRMIFVFLIILGIAQMYDAIMRRLPVSESQLRLAQEGLMHNDDWQPIIRHFSKLDWALVPPGCFNMGSTEAQLETALAACKIYGGENCPYVFDTVEEPGSQVCLEKPFWIAATEITNREYGSSSSTNMLTMYRAPDWPRETVTWTEAATFCAGIGARLPIEAEWEYAARGPDSLLYPWGNEIQAAFRENAAMLNPQGVKSVRVDRSWVDAWGMSGNVMEWVAEAFDPASTPVQIHPKVSQNGEQRLARGGSWASYADFLLRATQRIPYAPDFASSVVGFRCAHDFEQSP